MYNEKKIAMKINGLFSQSIAALLVVTFIVPASYFFKPEQAEASAQSCAVSYVLGTASTATEYVKEIIGVPVGTGQPVSNALTAGSTNEQSFNNCILRPLAKIMVVALIRNIGASIVDWVNSGFEGKPLFLTDLGGFLRDTADEAIGTFIEGTELGFLCKPFAFQIRIALAYKYSQPFRKRITCTLSQIGQNVDNFINNNGGVGWDDWLQLTTVPTNNVYGAYLTAESELAQRALNAAGIKTKKIELGRGFLDFETCDEWESADDVYRRTQGGENGEARGAFSQTVTSYGPDQFVGAQAGTQTQTTDGNSGIIVTTTEGGGIGTNLSEKPLCKKSTTKTPGSVIAGKLDSTFAQGDIQQAVAQEIDDVIAATMNQIAQKALLGAAGLLGLSKNKGYSSGSQYKQKYQALYFGDTVTPTSFNLNGATSESENYRFASFADASAGINANSAVQDINNVTDQTATKAVNEQLEQINATNSQAQGTSSAKNIALNQPARASSIGKSANNANNGIKSESVTVFGAAQPFQTAGNEVNPYWEVDLRSESQISEVKIWRPEGIAATESLETFRIEARDAKGDNDTNPWRSASIVASDSSPNPIIIPINQKKQYIRVVKDAAARQYNRRTYRTPLSLAEVEVMDTGTPVSGSQSSVTIGSGGATSTNVTIISTTPKLTITRGSGTIVTNSNNLIHQANISVGKDTSSGLALETALFRNGVPYPFLSVFSNYDMSYGITNGITLNSTVNRTTDASGTFTNITVTPKTSYTLTSTGKRRSDAPVGGYTLKTTLRNLAGEIIETQSTEFVVQ